MMDDEDLTPEEKSKDALYSRFEPLLIQALECGDVVFGCNLEGYLITLLEKAPDDAVVEFCESIEKDLAQLESVQRKLEKMFSDA